MDGGCLVLDPSPNNYLRAVSSYNIAAETQFYLVQCPRNPSFTSPYSDAVSLRAAVTDVAHGAILRFRGFHDAQVHRGPTATAPNATTPASKLRLTVGSASSKLMSWICSAESVVQAVHDRLVIVLP